MKVIYNCYGGTHSSPVAAAIHLGALPRNRIPTPDELMQTKLFDKVSGKDRGNLFFAGRDRHGNEIYVLGRGNEPKEFEAAIRSGMQLAGNPEVPVKFVDTLTCVNNWMRVGGFLSRAVGLVAVGRPLVIRGTKEAYDELRSLVESTEQGLVRNGSPTGENGQGEGAGLH